MDFKYWTSEFSWDKFYLIEHFHLEYKIMFAKRFKAKILRLEIFLILETNQNKIKEKVTFKFWLRSFHSVEYEGMIWVKQRRFKIM
jgi:hypothetical protein